MKKEVWIVGKISFECGWEIQGVFTNEAAAVEACCSPLHFIGPVTLNEALPEATTPWLRSYYPHSSHP